MDGDLFSRADRGEHIEANAGVPIRKTFGFRPGSIERVVDDGRRIFAVAIDHEERFRPHQRDPSMFAFIVDLSLLARPALLRTMRDVAWSTELTGSAPLRGRAASSIIGAATQPMEDGMGWREEWEAEQAEERKNRAESEARAARRAGTRQFFSQAWTEAMLDMLVDSGAVKAPDATVMLDRLAKRFENYPENSADEDWNLDPHELSEEAARVRALAGLYKARRPSNE